MKLKFNVQTNNSVENTVTEMESEDVDENESLTVQNSNTTPEIVLSPSFDNPNMNDEAGHPQITQNEVTEEVNEEKGEPDIPERAPSQLDTLKLDLEQQRRRSVELTEDLQNVERLKAQRERETQEVKKREMMPSFGTILQKKCREM